MERHKKICVLCIQKGTALSLNSMWIYLTDSVLLFKENISDVDLTNYLYAI